MENAEKSKVLAEKSAKCCFCSLGADLKLAEGGSLQVNPSWTRMVRLQASGSKTAYSHLCCAVFNSFTTCSFDISRLLEDAPSEALELELRDKIPSACEQCADRYCDICKGSCAPLKCCLCTRYLHLPCLLLKCLFVYEGSAEDCQSGTLLFHARLLYKAKTKSLQQTVMCVCDRHSQQPQQTLLREYLRSVWSKIANPFSVSLDLLPSNMKTLFCKTFRVQFVSEEVAEVLRPAGKNQSPVALVCPLETVSVAFDCCLNPLLTQTTSISFIANKLRVLS